MPFVWEDAGWKLTRKELVIMLCEDRAVRSRQHIFLDHKPIPVEAGNLLLCEEGGTGQQR